MNETVLIALIAVGGTIVGFLGSFVGTVIFPWLRDRSDRKRQERERIRDLMIEFQQVAQSVYTGRHTGYERIDQVLQLASLDFKLVSLLQGSSSPMGLMISKVASSARPDNTPDVAIYIEFKLQAKAWLSEAKTAAQAYADFLKNLPPVEPEGQASAE
ncbi:hypothetical protein [Rathayibacter sp. AY1D9]|uniref:hypothetical protein n=1 Tax=Rathayibacter sp. AY1D9 TaxID=2080548 RepID=UPI000CE87218|nr:hypothetical protein [Rathayibacter sp. AY1D9]PPH83923.1 hypothetical protein C5C50_04280 [Rathayibacter sp. AY1D9]